MNMPYSYNETEYETLIESAKNKWQFIFYNEIDLSKRQIIWRHDVDFSPQRALALARIEQRLAVKATYFFHLHNRFYNLLEDGMQTIISEIQQAGHRIGLHFDPLHYGNRIVSKIDLEKFLSNEKQILDMTFNLFVKDFSFHNPTMSKVCKTGDAVLAGMNNASAQLIQDEFCYISDSRGGWKRKDGPAIIHAGSECRLVVLTHPMRWTPTSMSEYEILKRCQEGRNEATAREIQIILPIWDNVNGLPEMDNNLRDIHESLSKHVREK